MFRFFLRCTVNRNLEHLHDASQAFGLQKSHALDQPAKGQS